MAPKGVSNLPQSSSSSSPSSSRDRVYRFISDPEHKETLSGRVRAACLTCRRKKIKCSGTEPCQTCRDRGLKCEGLPPRKRAKRVDPYQTATSQDGDLDDGESVIDSPGSYSAASSTSRQNSVGGISNQSNSLSTTHSSSRSPVLNVNTRGPSQTSPTGLQNLGANVAYNAPGYGGYQSSSPNQSQDWSAPPVAGPSTWTSDYYSRSRGMNTSSAAQTLDQRASSKGKMPARPDNFVSVDPNTQMYPRSSAVLTSNAPAPVDNLALLFPGYVEPFSSTSPQSTLDNHFIQQPFQSPTIETSNQSMLPFERTEMQLTPNWDAWNESMQQRDLQRQASQPEAEKNTENPTARPNAGKNASSKSVYLFSKASQRPWPYDQ